MTEAGLGCFNNPSSGNNISYRIIAVIRGCEGRFGGREPLNVIKTAPRSLAGTFRPEPSGEALFVLMATLSRPVSCPSERKAPPAPYPPTPFVLKPRVMYRGFSFEVWRERHECTEATGKVTAAKQ